VSEIAWKVEVFYIKMTFSINDPYITPTGCRSVTISNTIYILPINTSKCPSK
jgi:hypothetical protein